MKIQTELLSMHLELVKIFFEANELKDVVVGEYPKIRNKISHNLIEVSWDDESESGQKILQMSIINYGFNNMLDSFLIKCGVSPFHLHLSAEHDYVDTDLETHFMKIGLRPRVV